ncbi:MAG: hypothetical protein KDD35_12695, partial [Bdellovibrionales bacterium]|nr:hypothetical protein [Bdellovibrionales bacterium]
PKDPKPEDFQYWARDQAECNFEVSSGICVEMHWLDTPELKKDLAFELRVVDRDGQPVELRKLPEISFSKFESRETGSPVEIKPHLDQNGEPLLGEYLVERVYFYSEGFWLIQVALALEYNWISAQFAFPLVVMKREEGPFFKFN